MPILESHAELATYFDRSLATVKHWSRDGMPGERGAYDTDAIESWREQRHGNRYTSMQSTPEIEEMRLELLRAVVRLREAAAGKCERHERMAVESICFRGDAERLVARMLTEMKLVLTDSADRIAAQAPQPQRAALRDVIEQEVHSDLLKFREWVRRIETIDNLPAEHARDIVLPAKNETSGSLA